VIQRISCTEDLLDDGMMSRLQTWDIGGILGGASLGSVHARWGHDDDAFSKKLFQNPLGNLRDPGNLMVCQVGRRVLKQLLSAPDKPARSLAACRTTVAGYQCP
jgi:hypothetical protein